MSEWAERQRRQSREFLVNLSLALLLVFAVMAGLFESVRQAIGLMLVGLVPVAVQRPAQAGMYYYSMALVIMMGLVVSTFLTTLLLPTAATLAEDSFAAVGGVRDPANQHRQCCWYPVWKVARTSTRWAGGKERGRLPRGRLPAGSWAMPTHGRFAS